MLERKEFYDYNLKNWINVFTFSNENITLKIKCWITGGSVGFQHRAEVFINTSFMLEAYKNKFYKMQYYNRSWERYTFQSLLHHVIKSLEKDKILNNETAFQFKCAIDEF